jgi:hypothetical protein
MDGTWGTYGERTGAYSVLVRRPREKRPLRKPGRIFMEIISK